ncbi:hypothetical protein AGMMS49991_07770 [Spirochaetia bacterium]|nr:hypothetical protein AGMMS49991_07770 [Spirochaetia bacterium]
MKRPYITAREIDNHRWCNPCNQQIDKSLDSWIAKYRPALDIQAIIELKDIYKAKAAGAYRLGAQASRHWWTTLSDEALKNNRIRRSLAKT